MTRSLAEMIHELELDPRVRVTPGRTRGGRPKWNVVLLDDDLARPKQNRDNEARETVVQVREY